MSQTHMSETHIQELALPLDRDVFLRTLIRELSGTLQNLVGLEEASGFISVVGQSMGKQIDHTYKSALQVSNRVCLANAKKTTLSLKGLQQAISSPNFDSFSISLTDVILVQSEFQQMKTIFLQSASSNS